jgi:hypothetical protein
MMINEDFSARSKLQDIGRWYVTRFVEDVAQSLPENAAILDAGLEVCLQKVFSHYQLQGVTCVGKIDGIQ